MAVLSQVSVDVPVAAQVDEFDSLVKEYRLRAFHFALQLVGNREDAMDVTQEAFLKVHRNWHRRDPNRPFAPWFYAILRNQAIDLLRKRSSRKEDSPEDLPDPASPKPGPDLLAEKDELKEKVWLAIDQLSPPQREVVVLRDLHGFTYKEIAEITGDAVTNSEFAATRRPRNLAAQTQGVSVMPEKKVEELLSAYLDGELTQADQQRVRIHLEDSPEARRQYGELMKIREVTESMSFAPPPDGRMEELERRLSVQTPRRVGWLFFLLGAIALAAMALIAFATSPDIPPWRKLAISGVGLGVALLLASVARQRWLELPRDRYRGVRK